MPLTKENRNHRENLIKIGQYINDNRVKRKISLQQMSIRVGFNSTYIGEVEHGERIPDDYFIRNISKQIDLDENYIFALLGKPPLIAREELDKNVLLQETLKEIGMSSFSDQEKQEIYDIFYSITKYTMVNQINVQR